MVVRSCDGSLVELSIHWTWSSLYQDSLHIPAIVCTWFMLDWLYVFDGYFSLDEPWSFGEPRGLGEAWSLVEPRSLGEPSRVGRAASESRGAWESRGEPCSLVEPRSLGEPWNLGEPRIFGEPWSLGWPSRPRWLICCYFSATASSVVGRGGLSPTPPFRGDMGWAKHLVAIIEFQV